MEFSDEHVIEVSKEAMHQLGIDDVALYINMLLAQIEDNTCIVFKPDTYTFKREFTQQRFCYITNNDYGLKNIAFCFSNKKNITLDGSGSLFLFVGRIMPVYIEKCKNIILRNFSIDYTRPFFSQGDILQASKDMVKLLIDKEKYPYEIRAGRPVFTGDDYEENFIHGFLEYDKEKIGPAENVKDTAPKSYTAAMASKNEDGTLDLMCSFRQIPLVGNIMTIKHEPRYIPGIAADHSADVFLQNIWIKHSATMAVIAQFCRNVTLDEVKVAVDPKSERVVSANADATHFVGCSGKVIVRGCYFSSQLDDAMNVHGNYLVIQKILNEKQILIAIGHYQQVGIWGIEKGSEVEILNRKTMLPMYVNNVENIMPLNDQYAIVDLQKAVPWQSDLSYCLNDCDSYPEVWFQNNIVKNNRARGILLTSNKKTVIENNQFYTEGAIIKISGDMKFWFESGAVGDVIIRNNHLETTCNASWGHGMIDIDPEMDILAENRYYHNSISIEDNEVIIKKWPFIFGHSVENLLMCRNRFYAEDKLLLKNEEVQLDVKHIKHINMKA